LHGIDYSSSNFIRTCHSAAESIASRITIAGVVICSKQIRFDDFSKAIEMIKRIPLSKSLNLQRKLVFIHINQTIEEFILLHNVFKVRKKFQASFNSHVEMVKYEAQLAKKEDALA
jgi:hypothetical protein